MLSTFLSSLRMGVTAQDRGNSSKLSCVDSGEDWVHVTDIEVDATSCCDSEASMVIVNEDQEDNRPRRGLVELKNEETENLVRNTGEILSSKKKRRRKRKEQKKKQED